MFDTALTRDTGLLWMPENVSGSEIRIANHHILTKSRKGTNTSPIRNTMTEGTANVQEVARQHRINRRRGEKRSIEDMENDEEQRTIPLSAIKGVKKQARYEPVIPMSKKDLSKWRKEARRVRNRESAAASRRKTRERIEDLEQQVQTLEHKYAAAMKHIAELEKKNGPQQPSRVSPTLQPQENPQLPKWSLDHQGAASTLAQSTEPFDNILLPSELSSSSLQNQSTNHPNLMISRPTAVCVT